MIKRCDNCEFSIPTSANGSYCQFHEQEYPDAYCCGDWAYFRSEDEEDDANP